MMSQLQERFAIAAESRRIRRQVLKPPPVPAPLVGVANERAVWRVPVPGNEDYFMCLPVSGVDETSFVVHVRADAFYVAWLNSECTRKRRPDACVLRKAMPLDYKFHHAAEGFAHSRRSPVPLAWPDAYVVGGRPHICFIDGITRTFWLLAKGAVSFPMLVRGDESAKLLNEVAGIELLPVASLSA